MEKRFLVTLLNLDGGVSNFFMLRKTIANYVRRQGCIVRDETQCTGVGALTYSPNV